MFVSILDKYSVKAVAKMQTSEKIIYILKLPIKKK